MSFNPKWACAPGNTIKQILLDRNIPHATFSNRLGLSDLSLARLISGESAISTELAQLLSEILGASPGFWMKREEQYREDLLKIERLSEEAWLKGLPVNEMIKFGWLSTPKNKLKDCLAFFDVPDVNSWYKQYFQIEQLAAFRISERYKSDLSSVACWIRKGEIDAQEITCSRWNPRTFLESLVEIKGLSRKKKPLDFIPALKRICANSGVAVSIVRTPTGCKASGATKFLSPNKALLMLSFRYLSDDQFWFTFFHEAGHLLLHGHHETFIEGLSIGQTQKLEVLENEANSFASEMLIPHHLHSRLKQLKGKRDILTFALEQGISPGIVVGQMQFYGFALKNHLNGYKRRFSWDEITAQ